jgi:hypothetical protein
VPGASFGCVGLGVWTHDVVRGVGTWSEEVSRLLEHPPSALAPSWSALLARLHPEDSVQPTKGVDATEGGAGFGMDLRVATRQLEAALPPEACSQITRMELAVKTTKTQTRQPLATRTGVCS